jgi:hypothetical protein
MTTENVTLFAADNYADGASNSEDQGGTYHPGAMFFLDLTDTKSTAFTLAVKIQAKGYPGGDYFDYSTPWTVTEVAVGSAYSFVLAPSDSADDDAFMPRMWRAVATVGVTEADEVQTCDLGDIGAADTFKIQTDGAGTKTAAITYTAVGAGTSQAAAMQAALRLVAGYEAVTVVKVDQNTHTFTFPNAMGDVTLLKITDTATFDPKVDGGYTLGFIEATAGVAEPYFVLAASMLN